MPGFVDSFFHYDLFIARIAPQKQCGGFCPQTLDSLQALTITQRLIIDGGFLSLCLFRKRFLATLTEDKCENQFNQMMRLRSLCSWSTWLRS
jgi:hypothetical protein